MVKKYKILKNERYFFDNLTMKSLNLSEFEIIRLWRNNQINILRQNKKISKLEQIKYYNQNILKNMMSIKPDNILLSINYNNEFIGYGGLVHISWTNKRAEFSFLLNDKIKINSKKFKEIFFTFFSFIKAKLNLELNFIKITTETFVNRKKMISYLIKIGFKKEGYLKSHYKKKRYIDSVLHSFYL